MIDFRTQKSLDELLSIPNPDKNVQSHIENGFVKITALSILCIGLLSFLAFIYIGVLYMYGIKWASKNKQRGEGNATLKEVALSDVSSEMRSPVAITEKINPLEMLKRKR